MAPVEIVSFVIRPLLVSEISRIARGANFIESVGRASGPPKAMNRARKGALIRTEHAV